MWNNTAYIQNSSTYLIKVQFNADGDSNRNQNEEDHCDDDRNGCRVIDFCNKLINLCH